MEFSVPSYIILACMSLLGFVLLLQGFLLSRQTSGFLGKPSIPKFWFLVGKVSLFTTWGLMIAKVLNPSWSLFSLFPQLPWTAVALIIPGTIIMGLSFFHLGISLKVGLPESENTVLKTKGLYRFSRNPLYLGVYLITLAAMVYFPDLVNIILGITGIICHHLITLGEEKYLARRFGPEYEDYRRSVGRYF